MNAVYCIADQFQLDAFNFESGEYECVEVRDDSHELTECARLLGLKSWRVWNRTARAKRDRMLPPVPRVMNTSKLDPFRLVHIPMKKHPTTYKDFSA